MGASFWPTYINLYSYSKQNCQNQCVHLQNHPRTLQPFTWYTVLEDDKGTLTNFFWISHEIQWNSTSVCTMIVWTNVLSIECKDKSQGTSSLKRGVIALCNSPFDCVFSHSMGIKKRTKRSRSSTRNQIVFTGNTHWVGTV